jgi:hypothetical protein
MEHESGIWILLNDGAYTDEKGLSLEVSGIESELLIA